METLSRLFYWESSIVCAQMRFDKGKTTRYRYDQNRPEDHPGDLIWIHVFINQSSNISNKL